MSAIGARLDEGAGELQSSVYALLESDGKNPEDALAGATPFLKQCGKVAGGYYLGRGAMAAALAEQGGKGDGAFLKSKIAIVRFFSENYLTEAVGLTPAVTGGAAPLAPLDPASLTG